MTTRTLTRRHEAPLHATFGNQIARLEHQLQQLPPARTEESRRPARLLSVAELEAVRDDLVGSVHQARTAAERQSEIVRDNRELLARLLEAPEQHHWARITTKDIDELGCREWQSVPRLGLVGMLAGWWQVRISSGCP